MIRFLAICLLAALAQPYAVAKDAPALTKISRAELLDKVQGGWAGQMIGVSIGAPTEMMANDAPYRQPLNWDKPTSVSNAILQDDLYVEMTFAKVMDDEGLDAPAASYAKAFGASQYLLWHANYFARKNIQAGIMPPMSGHPQYNPHADDIDFQIEADFIGLMCPGMPLLTNRFCDRIGHVMNYGDGVYGGMFVSAMYAAAFFERDPEKVVRAGLGAIPAASDYARAIRAALDLHAAHPGDWRAAWDEFYIRFVNTDPCPELVLHPVDIDAKVNGAFITLALLYGDGDFRKTVTLAIEAGQDSDCNGASAAGIVGTILGYRRLPGDWTGELNKIRGQKFSFTNYSFDDVCASTMRRIEKTTVMAGGRASDQTFEIVRQQPQPAPLEQWHTGRPLYFYRHDMPMLKFTGAWSAASDQRLSKHAGDKATLIFDGTGFIVHLFTGPAYGMADIYLDGKKIGSFDGYRPFDKPEIEFFYKTLGTRTERHWLEVVSTGAKNPKASAATVGVAGVQVFGGEF